VFESHHALRHRLRCGRPLGRRAATRRHPRPRRDDARDLRSGVAVPRA
jgi:hypothetical protein